MTTYSPAPQLTLGSACDLYRASAFAAWKRCNYTSNSRRIAASQMSMASDSRSLRRVLQARRCADPTSSSYTLPTSCRLHSCGKNV